MNALAEQYALAPIPRRQKPDRGTRGPAAPRRVLTSVKVEVFDPIACEMVTETAQAYRNALPPLLAALPEPLQKAALAYAKAVEEVEAGGASDPAAAGLEGGAGASVFKEGRQVLALKQVRFLRDLESAVGPGVVNLGCRQSDSGGDSPVSITHLAILRAAAVDGLSVAGLLKGLRLGRSTPRCDAVIAAFLASVEVLAIHLGLIAEYKKQSQSEKTS